MHPEPALHAISDDELIRRLGELVSQSRRIEADLVAHIGEVDARGLYARQASPSMFAYCTEALHLSEAEAYRRITVARAARKHELLLTMLRDGRLHLSGIALLAPLLTPANREALLARATHRSKREIDTLVAELQPRPDVPSVMRKLPQPRTAPLPDALRGLEELHGEPDQAPGSRVALELVPGRVGTEAPASPAGFAAPPAIAFHLPSQLRQSSQRRLPPLRRQPRHGRLSSSRCHPPATRCSSPPAPSCTTSSSGSPHSCARKSPTVTSP
jgi:hypothetical protein